MLNLALLSIGTFLQAAGNRLRGGLIDFGFTGRIPNLVFMAITSSGYAWALNDGPWWFFALDVLALFLGQAPALGRIYGAMMEEEEKELDQGWFINIVADRFKRFGMAAWGWAGCTWRGIIWVAPLAALNLSWAILVAGLLWAPVYYIVTKLSGGRSKGWARSEWVWGAVLGCTFGLSKLYGF